MQCAVPVTKADQQNRTLEAKAAALSKVHNYKQQNNTLLSPVTNADAGKKLNRNDFCLAPKPYDHQQTLSLF